MAKRTVKRASKAPAKAKAAKAKTAKTAKAKAPAKTAKAPKANGPKTFNKADFLAIASRSPDSLKGKAADYLAARYGKPSDIGDLCKALYGKKDAPEVTPVLAGINVKLRDAGKSYAIIRAKGTVVLDAVA